MPEITHAQNQSSRLEMRRSLYDALLSLAVRRGGKLPAEIEGFKIAAPAPEPIRWDDR